MAKKSKNTKATISIKRRLSLYYLRFITLIKIGILLTFALLFFTDLLNKPKQKLLRLFVDKTAEAGLVFKHLVIVGQVNITEKEIIEAIGGDYGIPIYSLNIDDIRKRIEDNPWIKIALVERKLPDTLSVTITERTPIAIWQFKQKLYLIDEEGILETSDVNARFINGKPEAIESIYIMKSPEAWDRFMRFMERYGETNGLVFTRAS